MNRKQLKEICLSYKDKPYRCGEFKMLDVTFLSLEDLYELLMFLEHDIYNMEELPEDFNLLFAAKYAALVPQKESVDGYIWNTYIIGIGTNKLIFGGSSSPTPSGEQKIVDILYKDGKYQEGFDVWVETRSEIAEDFYFEVLGKRPEP